jgi:DNA gyrase subunit A
MRHHARSALTTLCLTHPVWLLCPLQVSDDDALAWALRCPGGSAILMASSDGQVLVFRGDDASLRATGRTAAGVQTMRLKPGAQIVSVELLPPHVAQLLPGTRAAAAEAEPESEVESELGAASSNGTGHSGSSAADAAASSSSDEEVDGSSTAATSGPWVLFVTENGMGKRVPVSEFRLSGRRGVGIKGLKLKAGDRLVAAHLVREEDEMVLASRAGLMTRCKAASVRGCSRGAVGVALMKLAQGDVVSTVAVVRAGQ